MRRDLYVVAGLTFLAATFYLVEAWGYPRGSLAQPGPGVFPLLVGIVLLFGALGVAVEAKCCRDATVDWPKGRAAVRVLAVVAAAGVYVALLSYVGHTLGALLLAVPILRAMGASSWPWSLGVASLVAVVSYYIFAVVLGVPLPVGWIRQ